jgi:hypothetical protein
MVSNGSSALQGQWYMCELYKSTCSVLNSIPKSAHAREMHDWQFGATSCQLFSFSKTESLTSESIDTYGILLLYSRSYYKRITVS